MATISSARNSYYDALKVLSIFLVCCYHSEWVMGVITIPPITSVIPTYIAYLSISLCSMAVPIFFMVNGALLLNKPLTISKHIQKTLKVIFLLLLWCCTSFVVISLLKGEKLTLLMIIKSAYTFKAGYSGHLWFLKAIVIIYILFPVIKTIFDFPTSNWLIYCTAALFFVFSFGMLAVNQIAETISFFNTQPGDNVTVFKKVYSFGMYFYPTFYFILGGLITSDRYLGNLKIKLNASIPIFICAWLILFGYGIIKSILSGIRFDTVYECYYSLMTLLMTVSAFFIAKQLKFDNPRIERLLNKVGMNILGIYILHPLINAAIKLTVGNYGEETGTGILAVIFNGGLLVLICYWIAELIKQIPVIRKSISI